MRKHSLIRTIYLYLFALIGLVLLTIGTVRFINMGLKAFVFKEAEKEEALRYKQPLGYYLPLKIGDVDKINNLSEQEKSQLKSFIRDYEKWRKERSQIDYVKVRREKDASWNLALILVGLPLYLYHWGIIRKEAKEN